MVMVYYSEKDHAYARSWLAFLQRLSQVNISEFSPKPTATTVLNLLMLRPCTVEQICQAYYHIKLSNTKHDSSTWQTISSLVYLQN